MAANFFKGFQAANKAHFQSAMSHARATATPRSAAAIARWLVPLRTLTIASPPSALTTMMGSSHASANRTA